MTTSFATLTASRRRTEPRIGRISFTSTRYISDGRPDALQMHLKERGISTSIYYPLPLHLQECFKDLGYSAGDLPVCEQASGEVLSLPMFPELSEEEQGCVVGAIKTFSNGL